MLGVWEQTWTNVQACRQNQRLLLKCHCACSSVSWGFVDSVRHRLLTFFPETLISHVLIELYVERRRDKKTDVESCGLTMGRGVFLCGRGSALLFRSLGRFKPVHGSPEGHVVSCLPVVNRVKMFDRFFRGLWM